MFEAGVGAVWLSRCTEAGKATRSSVTELSVSHRLTLCMFSGENGHKARDITGVGPTAAFSSHVYWERADDT